MSSPAPKGKRVSWAPTTGRSREEEEEDQQLQAAISASLQTPQQPPIIEISDDDEGSQVEDTSVLIATLSDRCDTLQEELKEMNDDQELRETARFRGLNTQLDDTRKSRKWFQKHQDALEHDTYVPVGEDYVSARLLRDVFSAAASDLITSERAAIEEEADRGKGKGKAVELTYEVVRSRLTDEQQEEERTLVDWAQKMRRIANECRTASKKSLEVSKKWNAFFPELEWELPVKPSLRTLKAKGNENQDKDKDKGQKDTLEGTPFKFLIECELERQTKTTENMVDAGRPWKQAAKGYNQAKSLSEWLRANVGPLTQDDFDASTLTPLQRSLKKRLNSLLFDAYDEDWRYGAKDRETLAVACERVSVMDVIPDDEDNVKGDKDEDEGQKDTWKDTPLGSMIAEDLDIEAATRDQMVQTGMGWEAASIEYNKLKELSEWIRRNEGNLTPHPDHFDPKSVAPLRESLYTRLDNLLSRKFDQLIKTEIWEGADDPDPDREILGDACDNLRLIKPVEDDAWHELMTATVDKEDDAQSDDTVVTVVESKKREAEGADAEHGLKKIKSRESDSEAEGTEAQAGEEEEEEGEEHEGEEEEEGGEEEEEEGEEEEDSQPRLV